MPPRTSRSSAARGTTTAQSSTTHHNKAIAYHASQIMILWVVIIALSLAGFFIALSAMSRLQAEERVVMMLREQVIVLEQHVQDLTTRAAPISIMPSTPDDTSASLAASPSGALRRGSMSPDGTKYAGYNDAGTLRRGIAVEIVKDGKIRYIELFSPSQSTGAGTEQESTMSVRWKDNNTIEYDVLVTEKGAQVKSVQSTQIFF